MPHSFCPDAALFLFCCPIVPVLTAHCSDAPIVAVLTDCCCPDAPLFLHPILFHVVMMSYWSNTYLVGLPENIFFQAN